MSRLSSKSSELVPVAIVKDKNLLVCIDTSNNPPFHKWVIDNLDKIKRVISRSSREKDKSIITDYFKRAGWKKPVFRQVRNDGQYQPKKRLKEPKKYKVKLNGNICELELREIAQLKQINFATLRYRVHELKLPLNRAIATSVGGRAFNSKIAPLVVGFNSLLKERSFDEIVKYVGLEPDEEDILRRRFASDTKITLEELGYEYDLTRERIRQKEAEALNKINDVYQLVAVSLD